MKKSSFNKRKAHGDTRQPAFQIDNRAANFSRNFSDIEDSDNSFDMIASVAARAGINAAREAKAAGLPRVYSRSNQLIEIAANGSVSVVTPRLKHANFYVKYKPSTILYVKAR